MHRFRLVLISAAFCAVLSVVTAQRAENTTLLNSATEGTTLLLSTDYSGSTISTSPKTTTATATGNVNSPSSASTVSSTALLTTASSSSSMNSTLISSTALSSSSTATAVAPTGSTTTATTTATTTTTVATSTSTTTTTDFYNTTMPPPTILSSSSLSSTFAGATTTEAGAGHGGEEEHITGLDLRFFADPWMDWVYLGCVAIATIVTLLDVREHVKHFNFPKIQVYTVRVIMMVPVYGVFSFMSINVPSARFFLDTMRDTYEAIVLYMFFMMLIEYGGGEGTLIRALNKKKYKGIHPVPFCLLPLFSLDQDFFLRCKRMVLQFAIWKPCASLVACILEPLGYYRESDFGFDNAYLYIYIMYNITLSYSLYYLVLFEIETEKELRYCKAAMKFLCIKSLIFFAFWQSMTLSFLVSLGVIYVGPEHEAEHVTTVMMNGLICLELLPVSYLHHYAFSREKLGWEMAAQPVFNIETEEVSTRQALDMSLTFDGVFSDLIATVFYRKGKLLDMENASDEEERDEGQGADGARGSAVSSVQGGRGGDTKSSRRGKGKGLTSTSGGPRTAAGGGGGVMDPTIDELVQFAFNNDRGIRPEGLLYVPDSSDEELYDDKVEYGDTDIIDPDFSVKTARGGQAALDSALATAAIDMVMASGGGALTRGGGGVSQTVGGGYAGSSAGAAAEMLVFCSVCGRFDRELVKRKDNYKCLECVGTKSIKELKNANKMFAGAISKAAKTVVDVSIKGVEGISGGAINIDMNKNAEYKFKDEQEMERQDLH